MHEISGCRLYRFGSKNRKNRSLFLTASRAEVEQIRLKDGEGTDQLSHFAEVVATSPSKRSSEQVTGLLVSIDTDRISHVSLW